MGIFDKKTKHEYLAYSLELYEDMPPLMRQTVAAAITQNRNISKDITTNLLNGIHNRANRLYRYALTDKFPWNLPNGTGTSITATKRSTVEACIRKDVGNPAYLGYMNIFPTGGGHYSYSVQYWLIGSDGQLSDEEYLWEYSTSEGRYPTLVITGSNQNTPYYPIIPLRQNDQYLADEVSKPHYSAIRGALRCIGLNPIQLSNGLKESEAENGDKAPNDIYIMLGVSVSRDSARTNEYLFRFFKKMFGTSTITEGDFLKWKENQVGETSPPQNTLTIKEDNYHQEIAWDYITHSINSGSVLKRGNYSVTFEENLGDTIDAEGYDYFPEGIRLRYQINANQYEEIVVHGLTCQLNVVGKEWIGVTLQDAFNNPNSPNDGRAFILPLRRDICNDMGAIRSHDLMYESIRMVSLDDYTYEVEWYETGFFKVFVLVVAVALTVLQQYWATGALTAASIAGVVVQTVGAAFVVQGVTPFLQDILGEELALLISVIGVAYGTTLNLSGTGSLISTSSPTTYSVVSAATQGLQGYKGLQYQDEIQALSQEFESIEEDLDELYAQEQQSRYDVGSVMRGIESDPYALLEASTFVKRALIEPTIPTLITSTTSNFVEVATHLDTSTTPIKLGH